MRLSRGASRIWREGGVSGGWGGVSGSGLRAVGRWHLRALLRNRPSRQRCSNLLCCQPPPGISTC